MAARLVVTLGDPRGIGPEVAFHALRDFAETRPSADVRVVGPEGPLSDARLEELFDRPSTMDDATAGAFAAESIERSVELALRGDVHGIVTAPLHKPSLHAAGWNVPGQTEFLARLSGTETVGMLMAAERTRLGGPLRVLLATTHLPLRDVAEAVTEDLVVAQTTLLQRALQRDWGIEHPVIALCAINPHASDGGLFGDEEERVFAPALARLAADGHEVRGPLPADTVFGRAVEGEFDAVVAPYHDVGMAAFKTVSFGGGVNVSIGLPFVRTSPDHGTAFDIAGTGTADPHSMLQALLLADTLSTKRFDTRSAHV